MSAEKIPFDRWIGVVLSVAMAIIAMVGLYYQKVQVDGASGKLIAELNEKLDKLQTSVNERFTKVEQPQKVAALEKQVTDLKTTLASLETKYKGAEEQKQLTEFNTILTQRQIRFNEALKAPPWSSTAGTGLLTQPAPKLPESTLKLPESWTWLKEEDKKKLDTQILQTRKAREWLDHDKPLQVGPLLTPPPKPFPQNIWDTIKSNPVVVVVLIVLVLFSSKK